MSFKSFHNNEVSLLHFPGQQKNLYWDKIQELKELPVTKPDDISIVCILTPDKLDEAPLHYQLTKSGIEYYNSVPENHKMWINKHKPQYVVDALKQVNTEFTLVTDGNDVVLVDDLEKMKKAFFGYEKLIMFNATSNRFPNIPLDFIPYVDEVPGTRQILFGPFCYLNAGVCFGYTDVLIQFYQEVAEATKYENVPSEQYYVRKVMGVHQDQVFFDYDCRMFQAFNRGVEFSKIEGSNDVKLLGAEKSKRLKDISKQ